MIAMMTYRSSLSFGQKFERNAVKQTGLDGFSIHNEGNGQNAKGPAESLGDEIFGVYAVQSYLRYQGTKFHNRFDANCYIHITRKLDTHDISRNRGNHREVLAGILMPTLVVGMKGDLIYPIEEQIEIAENIPNAKLVIADTIDGHDGFLLHSKMNQIIGDFMSSSIKFI
jgi:homoserine O-acetyltransferase